MELNEKVCMTRKQIIRIWSDQFDGIKDNYCCPDCRDFLSFNADDNLWYCGNLRCKEFEVKFKLSKYVQR